MASRQPNSRTGTNQVLGSGIGLTILGFVASFFELEQASRVLTGSLFDRWALLFILGFTGTLLVAAATWRSRKALISREDQRSAMKTNALEIAAFIVMAIAVLAGLNDDKTHVFGTNVPLWVSGLAALVLSASSAALILAGAWLITRSFRDSLK